MAIILKTTGSTTYGGNEFDYVLQLDDEEIGRCVCVTGSWKHIKLGVRLHVSQSSGTMNANLAFGLCSGTASMYNTSSTRYFIGMRITSSVGLLDGPRAGGGSAGYGRNGDVNIISRTGSTEVTYDQGNISMSLGGKNFSNEIRNGIHFLDFIKPDGYTDPGLIHVVFTYPIYATFPPTNSELEFTNYSAFFNALMPITSSLPAGHLRYEFDMPVSESVYGTLDTVNLYWSGSRPIDISDVGVSIFSWM